MLDLLVTTYYIQRDSNGTVFAAIIYAKHAQKKQKTILSKLIPVGEALKIKHLYAQKSQLHSLE